MNDSIACPLLDEQKSELNVNSMACSPLQRINVLDNVERAVVLAFYAQLFARMILTAYQSGNLASLIILPSEALVVVLIIFRRRTDTLSLRWQDWMAALCATILPTFVISTGKQPSLSIGLLAAFLGLVGFIVQVHGKICLGRSFGLVAANRGIKSSGPYRFVRHPIYAGYLFGHVAFLIMFPAPWNICVLCVALLLQLYRIRGEENVLSLDPLYVEYQKQVRYRMIPGLF